jgi:hypothetical protein
MDLTGYGIIKIVDKKLIKDRITGKDIFIWKLYITSDSGDTFFLWSQKDWSEFLDTPACFVLVVGNKGKGFYLRVVDILPKDLPRTPKPIKNRL